MINLCSLAGREKKKLMHLCQPLEKVKLSQLDFSKGCFAISEKVDGVFCLALKLHDRVSIFSRTGELYTSMGHIEEELNRTLRDQEIIIFEATAKGFHTEQATVSGWCRDKKNQHPALIAACHTYLTLSAFQGTQEMTFSYSNSLLSERIKEIYGRYVAGVSCYKIPSKAVGSLEEAQAYADRFIAKGREGVILRNHSAIYEGGKRNLALIKIKERLSVDLKVLDVYEGNGKYSGNLGGLICQWKDGKTIRISGMTDEQRKAWWENPQEIIGKIVQVDAMKESSKGLLREPRFKGIRFDKLEGDY